MKDFLDRIGGFDFELDKKNIYIACNNKNAICKINIDTRIGEIISFVDNNNYFCDCYWSKCAKINNSILFAPGFGTDIVIYDIETERVQYIDISGIGKKYLDYDTRKFWEVAIYDKYFLVMGYKCPKYLLINSETYDVSYIDFFQESYDISDQDYYISDNYIKLNNELCFPTGIGKESALLFLDVENKTSKLKIFDNGIEHMQAISLHDDEVWITDADRSKGGTGRVLIWNYIKDIVFELLLPRPGVWFAPIFWNDKAYFFPMEVGGKSYIVDINSHKYTEFYDIDRLMIEDNQRKYSFMCVKQINDTVIFVRWPDCTWFKYSLSDEKLTELNFKITDSNYCNLVFKNYNDKIFDSNIRNNIPINERDLSLNEYLARIKDIK